jgi:hypothetical protein
MKPSGARTYYMPHVRIETPKRSGIVITNKHNLMPAPKKRYEVTRYPQLAYFALIESIQSE